MSRFILSPESRALVELALREDSGDLGDITSAAMIPEESTGVGRLVAKSHLNVCGHPVGLALLAELGGGLKYQIVIEEGFTANPGDVIAEISGNLRALLLLERTLLNFFQRLSGIATMTAKAVELAEEAGVRILDTRKTTPGMRQLEKYAVTVGGGVNHRFGLFDRVLIKNNHVDAVDGDIALAIRRAREFLLAKDLAEVKIEVEVRDLTELARALTENPDRVMFDNFPPELVSKGLKLVHDTCGDSVEIEVSGGITLANLPAYAICGVDYISLGFLTHSVKSADISFRIET